MPTSPNSLLAWKELELGKPARAAWAQFEPFFEEHGYKLFVINTSLSYVDEYIPPPECSVVRSEDDYNPFLPYRVQMKPQPSRFFPATGIHIAARSPRNTDVVIRIMAIGDDGQEHLAIMRALAAPDAQVSQNHTVPMLEELQKDDVVFGIFPFMWYDGFSRPWFKTVREVLDALEQVLEGFVFLHQRLIAHRDFAFYEVFTNYGRDWDFGRDRGHCNRIPPTFRSVCADLRYLINDYELSVQFAPDSDPRTRLVTGIPTARYGDTPDMYCKPLAPEALLDAPYCPFKADIYQIGQCAIDHFANVADVPGLQELFVAMTRDDPEARPTAVQALATLRAIQRASSEGQLDAVPTDKALWHRRLLPGEACGCSFCSPPCPAPYHIKKELPLQGQVVSAGIPLWIPVI